MLINVFIRVGGVELTLVMSELLLLSGALGLGLVNFECFLVGVRCQCPSIVTYIY